MKYPSHHTLSFLRQRDAAKNWAEACTVQRFFHILFRILSMKVLQLLEFRRRSVFVEKSVYVLGFRKTRTDTLSPTSTLINILAAFKCARAENRFLGQSRYSLQNFDDFIHELWDLDGSSCLFIFSLPILIRSCWCIRDSQAICDPLWKRGRERGKPYQSLSR